jgi:hypothetical protein
MTCIIPHHTIPYMADIGSMGGWLVDGKGYDSEEDE